MNDTFANYVMVLDHEALRQQGAVDRDCSPGDVVGSG